MHYKDGQEAKIGDVAKGKPYNTPHEVVGVVTLLRACDSCNLTIAFAELSPPQPTGENVFTIPRYPRFREDYGRVGDFELVYRDPLTQAF